MHHNEAIKDELKHELIEKLQNVEEQQLTKQRSAMDLLAKL